MYAQLRAGTRPGEMLKRERLGGISPSPDAAAASGLFAGPHDDDHNAALVRRFRGLRLSWLLRSKAAHSSMSATAAGLSYWLRMNSWRKLRVIRPRCRGMMRPLLIS